MLRPSRCVVAGLVALAAAGLTGCASHCEPARSARGADTSIVVLSNAWLNGAFESCRADADHFDRAEPAASVALQPHDPWLGTIGLRRLLPGHSEIGFGVALPNSVSGGTQTPLANDFVRSAAAGIWLKFDF